MIETQENDKKTSFWTWSRPVDPKFGPPFFFFKNLASSVTRDHGQLSACTIWDKTNDPILRKLSDGWTDGKTDGRERFHKVTVQIGSSVQYKKNYL